MSLVDDLERISQLKQQGALSESEYNEAKAALLKSASPAAIVAEPDNAEQPPQAQVPTPAAPPAQAPQADKKPSAFLDPKSNLKALARVAVLLGVLGGSIYLTVRCTVSERAAETLVKSAVKAPIDLRDEVVNLPASSWQGLPINLPYTGELSLQLQVLKGNEVNVFVIDKAEITQLEQDKQFSHFQDFNAEKTKTLKRSGRLSQGTYYIVLTDKTLGVLSADSSDIRVKATLWP
ncbi:MAG: hypothetical protein Tsb0020_16570 [Haliangiales bacterium]